jgi:hypothetical protein
MSLNSLCYAPNFLCKTFCLRAKRPYYCHVLRSNKAHKCVTYLLGLANRPPNQPQICIVINHKWLGPHIFVSISLPTHASLFNFHINYFPAKRVKSSEFMNGKKNDTLQKSAHLYIPPSIINIIHFNF